MSVEMSNPIDQQFLVVGVLVHICRGNFTPKAPLPANSKERTGMQAQCILYQV
jgi:hypothetical protein